MELERKGERRATIEPYHREWIRVRNQHRESIEVSLATPEGSLLVLSPGKTIITLGFQQVLKRPCVMETSPLQQTTC